jgi:hypothetical protein
VVAGVTLGAGAGAIFSGTPRDLTRISKELGIPIKGLTPEAAAKKIQDVMVNRRALEEYIQEGIEKPPEPVRIPEAQPTEAEGKVETIDRAATRIRSTGEIAIAEKQSLHDETSVAALAKKHNTTKEDIIARINQPKRYQEDERWNMLSDPDLEQGFITSDGRFVTREESAKVQPFKSIIKKGLRKEPDALDIGVEAQPRTRRLRYWCRSPAYRGAKERHSLSKEG